MTTERKKIVFLDSDEDTGDAVVTIGAGGVRALEVVAEGASLLPLDVDPADFEDPTNPVNFDSMVSRAEAEAEAEAAAAAEGGVLSFVEDATAVPVPSAADAVRAAGWVPSRVVTAHGATDAPFEGAFASMHSRVTPNTAPPRMPLGLGMGLGGFDAATGALRDLMSADNGPAAARRNDYSRAGPASRRRERDEDAPEAASASPERERSPVAPARSYPVTSTLVRFVDSSDEDQDGAPHAIDATTIDWEAAIMNAGADGIPSLVAADVPIEDGEGEGAEGSARRPGAAAPIIRREGHADGRSVVQVVDSYRLTLDERDYLDKSVEDLVMNRSSRGQLTFAARAFLAEQETLVGGDRPAAAQMRAQKFSAAAAGAAAAGAPADDDEDAQRSAIAEHADGDNVEDDEEAEEEDEEEAELDDAVAIAAVEQLVAVCVAELRRDGETDPIAAALAGAYDMRQNNTSASAATPAVDPNAPVEFVDARALQVPFSTPATAADAPVVDAVVPTPIAAAPSALPPTTHEMSDEDAAGSDDEGAGTADDTTLMKPVEASTTTTVGAAPVDDLDADAAPSRPPPLRAFRHFLSVAVPALREVQGGVTVPGVFVRKLEDPMFRMHRALAVWNRPTAPPRIVIDGKVMDL